MAGVDLDLDSVMRELHPNAGCWGRLDQLGADDALPWSQLQQMLRGALEQGKTTQARRTAAHMFNGKQMQDYTALMDNPRRWLGQQSAPSNARERELLTLALSRLARSDDREAQAQYIDKLSQQEIGRAHV